MLWRCHHGTTAEHEATWPLRISIRTCTARSCSAQTALPTGRDSRQIGGHGMLGWDSFRLRDVMSVWLGFMRGLAG
jgi:hypothetical protein